MAATLSTMLPLGTPAPDFTLFNPVTGAMQSLAELRSRDATVIMFICNHCPYVIHVRKGLIELANDYIPRGVAFIAISSNDAANYPQDGPDRMKEDAERYSYPFPYLYDATQEVAQAYQAACTPDFFIFDKNMKCAYRGQMDDSRPGNSIPVTGKDMRAALDNILDGELVNPRQAPSIGCNIKWK